MKLIWGSTENVSSIEQDFQNGTRHSAHTHGHTTRTTHISSYAAQRTDTYDCRRQNRRSNRRHAEPNACARRLGSRRRTATCTRLRLKLGLKLPPPDHLAEVMPAELAARGE